MLLDLVLGFWLWLLALGFGFLAFRVPAAVLRLLFLSLGGHGFRSGI